MSNLRDMDWQRLADYLAGELSPQETSAMHAWVEEDVRHRELLERLRAAWNEAAASRQDPVDVERLLGSVRERLAPELGVPGHAVRTPASPRPLQGRPGVHRAWLATSAALIACIGVLWYGTTRTSERSQSYRTAVGQQSTIHLADGSLMVLAPATTVTIDRSTINVDGEAYFTVAPHADRVFMVRTTNATVRVLGTRFSVRQYAGESQSRVIVEEGKVALGSSATSEKNGNSAVLSAQMMGQMTDSGIVVTPNISAREYTSWTRGELVFREMPLEQVVGELARAYGGEIRIADSLLARKLVTLRVSVQQESLAEVLNGLGLVTNAHYTRVKNAYILTPGRSPGNAPQKTTLPHLEKAYGR